MNHGACALRTSLRPERRTHAHGRSGQQLVHFALRIVDTPPNRASSPTKRHCLQPQRPYCNSGQCAHGRWQQTKRRNGADGGLSPCTDHHTTLIHYSMQIPAVFVHTDARTLSAPTARAWLTFEITSRPASLTLLLRDRHVYRC